MANSRRISRSIDCFEKLEQIGEGTFGQVFRARDIATGEIVAIKRLQMYKESKKLYIYALREIEILQKLKHPNIIKLKEIIKSKSHEDNGQANTDENKCRGSVYLVFEYMDHSLTGLSLRHGQRFTDPQIKCYMKQLLTGLQYCHLNEVIHRDIKGSSLLINKEGQLKLAHFMLARSFPKKPNTDLTNCVISLCYRPPELLLGARRYKSAVDMWSVGCIFAELLCNKPILPGNSEADQLRRIYELCGSPDEGNWPGFPRMQEYDKYKAIRPMERKLRERFAHFDRPTVDLLDKMLTLDPSQRITANDALDSEYFRCEPLPCAPESLAQYDSSHELCINKKRPLQNQNEDMVKKQKTKHSAPAQ